MKYAFSLNFEQGKTLLILITANRIKADWVSSLKKLRDKENPYRSLEEVCDKTYKEFSEWYEEDTGNKLNAHDREAIMRVVFMALKHADDDLYSNTVNQLQTYIQQIFQSFKDNPNITIPHQKYSYQEGDDIFDVDVNFKN